MARDFNKNNIHKTLAKLTNDLGFYIDQDVFDRFKELIVDVDSQKVVNAINEIYEKIQDNFFINFLNLMILLNYILNLQD